MPYNGFTMGCPNNESERIKKCRARYFFSVAVYGNPQLLQLWKFLSPFKNPSGREWDIGYLRKMGHLPDDFPSPKLVGEKREGIVNGSQLWGSGGGAVKQRQWLKWNYKIIAYVTAGPGWTSVGVIRNLVADSVGKYWRESVRMLRNGMLSATRSEAITKRKLDVCEMAAVTTQHQQN